MPDLPRDWNQCYLDADTPWDSGEPSQELVRLLEEFQIEPCRALEIGCGTGTNSVFLAEQGFEVAACDISPTAIERAQEKARAAAVRVEFRVADLLDASALDRLSAADPFRFVFDHGVYHVLRTVDLKRFLGTLRRATQPAARYLVLTGNANDLVEADKGPPKVSAGELAPLFDLVQLREFRFEGVVIDGEPIAPLGWSAMLRRKDEARIE